ncbi:MAG: crosslink repair DNA glycosylase YcaQ family protein, partial [Caulobacteraceae bacterium]
MKDTLSASHARRIALAAQGLADARPTGETTPRRLRALIDRLGAVQIDSVNVLTRTHYLPTFSRLGAYPRETLEAAAWGGKPTLFEYWGHEASLLPVGLQPLFRWRMERARAGETWTGLARFGR